MKRTHVITGATGFLGGAIALELLERTDDRLLCGVRGENDAACRYRLTSKLKEMALAYAAPHLLPEIEQRCRAFPLNLQDSVDPHAVPAISGGATFWHAAASLRYEERHREQIFRDNVQGTANVLELARAIGAERFCHVSTAYVVGRQDGLIAETVPEGEIEASNCYEISKLHGERLVVEQRELETRVLRPSIVIGHQRTLQATSFSGLYGFLREVQLFERKVENRLGSILSMRPLSVIVNATAPINFIPVDVVARDAVSIGLAETDRQVFHLTNDSAPPVGDTLNTLFAQLGLPKPRHVTSSRAFTTIDQTLHDHLEFYSSYMNSHKRFSRVNTDSIVGEGAGEVPLPHERMSAFAAWYLDQRQRDRKPRASVNAPRGVVGVQP